MKSACRAMLLVLAVYCAGCSYAPYAYHNIVSAPIDQIQECAFRMRIRHTARSIWHDIRRHDKKAYSAAYAQGFEDGFVDYVDRNGTGEPPGMPPIHLRRESWRNGPNDIEDWYAGFRHGASAAMESGLRERIIVPVGRPPWQPTDYLSTQRDFPPTPQSMEMPKIVNRDSPRMPADRNGVDVKSPPTPLEKTTPAEAQLPIVAAPQAVNKDREPDPVSAPFAFVGSAPPARVLLHASSCRRRRRRYLDTRRSRRGNERR